MKLAFGGFLGIKAQTVSAQAKVSVVGKMRLCMLTLDPGAPGAFSLQKLAQVTANGCSLYSNSTNAAGMVGGDSAIARADTICSAGGYRRRSSELRAYTAGWMPGDPGSAEGPRQSTHRRLREPALPVHPTANGNMPVIDKSVTLEPGTYCGGLQIKKNSVVTLKPGIYVMKDGPLIVKDKATFTGTDVGFYFTGDKGGLVFDKDTTIRLTAPTTGEMAGLLMAEQTSVSDPVDPTILANLLDPGLGLDIPPTPAPLGQTKPMRTYRIISNNARTMLGTIYLPSGRLVIDADRPVADQSAYTVVVAQQVNLYQGPNLYLNANYDATAYRCPRVSARSREAVNHEVSGYPVKERVVRIHANGHASRGWVDPSVGASLNRQMRLPHSIHYVGPHLAVGFLRTKAGGQGTLSRCGRLLKQARTARLDLTSQRGALAENQAPTRRQTGRAIPHSQ